MTKLLSTTALVVILAAATSAHAEIGSFTVVSKTITYGDTELASPKGANRLLERIDLAARGLCAPNSTVAWPYSHAFQVCRTKAVAKAVGSLAAPLVTAAYERRGGVLERGLASR